MPRPQLRTKTFRKVFVKTPGGKTVTQYKRRKPSHAKCANCERRLAGVPRDIPARIKKLPKTQRRPDRPFGGIYCPKCSKQKILETIRK
jgi:large subunit ribosomal protein L34e